MRPCRSDVNDFFRCVVTPINHLFSNSYLETPESGCTAAAARRGVFAPRSSAAVESGATTRHRTPDLLLTRELLCRLSYGGGWLVRGNVLLSAILLRWRIVRKRLFVAVVATGFVGEVAQRRRRHVLRPHAVHRPFALDGGQARVVA